MSDDLTRTSYHEAGHAVTASALGVRVYSATIVPADGNNGLTVHDEVLYTSVDSAVAILLAGGLAVWECGWRRGEKLPSTCWLDIKHFDDYMILMSHNDGTYKSDDREQYDEWRDGEALALQTLSDYWGAVEAVAAALLEHGTIRGQVVTAIVAAHKRKSEKEKTNVAR